MLNNLEKLINCGYELCIKPSRYSDKNFLVGLDSGVCTYNSVIKDFIEKGISPGDAEALDSLDILDSFSNRYPGFLFVKADTIMVALLELDKRAEVWNKIDMDKQDDILKELADYNCN